MSTDTVLTDEQIGDLYLDWHCFFQDNPGSAGLCIRAIEQAVLQSPEVQAWKRDAERIQFFESQCGGDWLKLEVGNWIVDTGSRFGMGEGLRSAIDAAMEKQT